MSAHSETYPPPNNPDDFESLCLDLWKDIWGDIGAAKNGRSGQPQAGVDVYGQTGGQWIGVQCKQKDGLLRSKVTITELEREVGEGLKFKPKLSRFILATTGAADARVQQRARELTDEHQAKGLFSVEVWAWPKIWHELYGREKLLRRIGPIYWPRNWRLILDSIESLPSSRIPSSSFRIGLTVSLQQSCVRVLKECWEFRDKNTLEPLFGIDPLSKYSNAIPLEARSQLQLIETVVHNLVTYPATRGEALLDLLGVLRDKRDRGDPEWESLDQLWRQVNLYLNTRFTE